MAIVTTRSQPVRANSDDDKPANSQPSDVSWQVAMRTAIRDPAQLCRMLKLPDDLIPAARSAAAQFPLFAPLSYISRMQVGNVHDPLLRQVLPLIDELQSPEGFTFDPVDDSAAKIVPGLLKKYAGRALMVTTGACAVHCRYCFRRHFPYGEGPDRESRWDGVLRELQADHSIDEVILSGGDPLTLDDDKIESLVQRITTIGHVRRLRIHTRLPIIIPARVTGRLVDMVGASDLTAVVVLHTNHANELDAAVANSISALADSGIVLLNQAVLLRGINDCVETQFELCRQLVDLRVMPYYLHQLDRVAGAAHFETSETLGVEIIEQLRARLPGYAVPRFVREIPGDLNKRVLA